VKPNVFQNPEGKALVGKIRASEDLKATIDAVVAAIGGFQKVVARGDTILLKPNLNTADPPPASSDPLFVKALIELLYDYGAARVVLGESSTITASTRRVLDRTKMLEVGRQTGAEILPFEQWVGMNVGGRYLKRVGFARVALEAPRIVYATCLKTHRLADFTMSLKLAVAFMRPRDRILLHMARLREKIAELNTLVAPDLILTDGRLCFISGGPSSGECREPGIVLASGDRIAVDVEGLRILQSYPGGSLAGRDPWALTQIRRAVELGLGARGPHDYTVVETAAPASARLAHRDWAPGPGEA
jgi:uncharacterized protein (DUF362 family)